MKMFTKYVFTSSISSDVEYGEGFDNGVKLSLLRLDDYLSGRTNTFENSPFNIEMARFLLIYRRLMMLFLILLPLKLISIIQSCLITLLIL